MDREQRLAGGNASGPVVKVGDTVRKRWTPSSPGVHDFLAHLRRSGIDAPEPRGRDADGRQIVEYVAGPIAMDAVPLTHDELRRVGTIVRAIHDASASYSPPVGALWDTAIPAPGSDLVSHNDLAPWNLVIGDRWVFIDWDAAAPSTRLWDLAHAAQTFTLSDVEMVPESAAARLRALVDGYDADDALRAGLPEAMHQRAAAMLHLLTTAHAEQHEPWASMFVDGHGSHWAGVVDYVGAHRVVWQEALTR